MISEQPAYETTQADIKHGNWPAFLVLFSLLVAIAASAYLTFRHYSGEIRREAHDHLNAIADLKVSQINRWRSEQRNAAETIHGDNLLANAVRNGFAKGAVEGVTSQAILTRLESIRQVNRYKFAVLLDEKAQPRPGEGGNTNLDSHDFEFAMRAIRENTVLISDLHLSDENTAEIDMVAPLVVPSRSGSSVVGAVYVRIDPSEFLFPYIQAWPNSSPSGETLLARREGENALFLNELRHRSGSALIFRVPIDQSSLPVSQALSGRMEDIEGVDYRSIPVLASARNIPDTPWVLVAKLDQAEIYEPISRLALAVTGLAALILLLTTLASGLWWRTRTAQQQAALYKSELDRLQSEEALTVSLSRFRDLVENLSDWVWEIDQDGNYKYCAPRVRDLLGYAPEELLGTSPLRLMPPTEAARMASVFGQHFAARKPMMALEHVKLCRDGRELAVESSGVPIFDSQGAYRGYRGTDRDLTEHKRSERSVAEGEERFRSMARAALDAIILVDHESKVRFWNPAAEQMFGRSTDEVLGQSMHPLIAPARYQKDAHAGFAKFVTSGEGPLIGKTVEIFALRKDGTEFPVEISFSGIKTDGRWGALGIVRDITKRKQLEDQHRLTEKVLESSGQGIVVTDARNNILWINKAFTDITGYSEDEVVGRNPRMLSSGKHGRAFYLSLWESLHETGHWHGEVWDKRKNGEIYPEWLSINTVKDENGKRSHHIAVFSDLTESKAAEERIQFLANYDPLTRLPNRTLLGSMVESALANCSLLGLKLWLLSINLDRFKEVNDALGHAMGDQLLSGVAIRLRGCLRRDDILARTGGDEFMIAMNGSGSNDAAIRVAEDCLKALSQGFTLDGTEVSITPSIGISVYPDDGMDAGTLIKNAGAAMHFAKESGRDTYRFYSREIIETVVAMRDMERRLRYALELGEFQLHYQPQIDLASGRIVGAEALIRWRVADGTMVSPAQFIPVAESRGLIVPIGDWVLGETCRQNREWQDAGLPAIPIAVNISGIQFQQKNFVEKVSSTLAESGLAPQYLELEITEGVIMHDAEVTLATVAQLRQMGLALSIDDFGTGYSSLSYLKRFSVHKLKIDQSFVRGLPMDTNDAAIAIAVIGMGKGLGLTVIAEGVETAEQRGFLQGNGCDEIQGYLISRPVSAADFGKLLQEHEATRLGDIDA